MLASFSSGFDFCLSLNLEDEDHFFLQTKPQCFPNFGWGVVVVLTSHLFITLMVLLLGLNLSKHHHCEITVLEQSNTFNSYSKTASSYALIGFYCLIQIFKIFVEVLFRKCYNSFKFDLLQLNN